MVGTFQRGETRRESAFRHGCRRRGGVLVVCQLLTLTADRFVRLPQICHRPTTPAPRTKGGVPGALEGDPPSNRSEGGEVLFDRFIASSSDQRRYIYRSIDRGQPDHVPPRVHTTTVRRAAETKAAEERRVRNGGFFSPHLSLTSSGHTQLGAPPAHACHGCTTEPTYIQGDLLGDIFPARWLAAHPLAGVSLMGGHRSPAPRRAAAVTRLGWRMK